MICKKCEYENPKGIKGTAEYCEVCFKNERKQCALKELDLFKKWLLKDAIPLHMDKPLVILADKSKLQCEENYISDKSILKQLRKRIKELERGKTHE